MPSLSSHQSGFLGLWWRENKYLDHEGSTMPCLLSLQLRLRLASYPKITQTTLMTLPSGCPECKGTLLAETCPSFSSPPHMQNKNSVSEEESALKSKGKNPYTAYSLC